MLLAAGVYAQRPAVEKLEGHVIPVMAQITFPDKSTKTVMITGFSAGGYSHIVKGKDAKGTDTKLWLDTIAAIEETTEDTTEQSALFILKDGKRVRLKNEGSRYSFNIAKDNGGTGKIEVAEVQSVKFLKPARKDGNNNAMFDDWQYSPFTGEKLPAP